MDVSEGKCHIKFDKNEARCRACTRLFHGANCSADETLKLPHYKTLQKIQKTRYD